MANKSTKKAKGAQTKTEAPSSSSSGKVKIDRKAKGDIARGSIANSSNGKVNHKSEPSHEVQLSALTVRSSIAGQTGCSHCWLSAAADYS